MNTRQSDMVPTTIVMMSDTTAYYYCTINLTVILNTFVKELRSHSIKDFD